MPMTIQELTALRRMTVHRLHLLETGEMSVRCLRTARMDNTAAISAARLQITYIDTILATKGREASTKPFISMQATGA